MSVYTGTNAGITRQTVGERVRHIGVMFATEVGAIVGGMLFLVYGVVDIVFHAFGIDLLNNFRQAQWVVGNGFETWGAFWTMTLGYVIAIAAAVIIGALVAMFSAALYNLFSGPAEDI